MPHIAHVVPAIQITIDPSNRYPTVEPIHLLSACGVVPGWITDPDKPFMDQVAANYPWGLGNNLAKSKIDIDSGEYCYPGDPPRHPLIAIESSTSVQKCFMYDSAMIVFVDEEGNTYTTRVD